MRVVAQKYQLMVCRNTPILDTLLDPSKINDEMMGKAMERVREMLKPILGTLGFKLETIQVSQVFYVCSACSMPPGDKKFKFCPYCGETL